MTYKVKPIALTYDDVLIEPTISTVESRSEPDTSTKFAKIPVMASPMDTVTEITMATAMNRLGGHSILHRFVEPDIQAKWVSMLNKPTDAGVAVGVNDEEKERLGILWDAGSRLFCVDVSNGQSSYSERMIKYIKTEYPKAKVIGGSVATADGTKFLEDAGADMIRVGIGGGSFCTTRTTTGIGVPQLSAVLACADIAEVPIIADGGIRNPADAVKAIGAGADVVMLGGLLVGTDQSPGEVIVSEDYPPFKFGRGMASIVAQLSRPDRMQKDADDITPEGIDAKVPYVGSIEQVIKPIIGGLRSAMSYCDARTIKEFQENVVFVQVTNAGLVESHPHILDY